MRRRLRPRLPLARLGHHGDGGVRFDGFFRRQHVAYQIARLELRMLVRRLDSRLAALLVGQYRLPSKRRLRAECLPRAAISATQKATASGLRLWLWVSGWSEPQRPTSCHCHQARCRALGPRRCAERQASRSQETGRVRWLSAANCTDRRNTQHGRGCGSIRQGSLLPAASILSDCHS